jgi:hypothetical protein
MWDKVNGQRFTEVPAQDDLSAKAGLRGFNPHLIGDLRIVGGHKMG